MSAHFLQLAPKRRLASFAFMAVLSVYGVWCAEHGFKVDELTLETTPILVMKCPKCGKLTKVGFDGRTPVVTTCDHQQQRYSNPWCPHVASVLRMIAVVEHAVGQRLEP